MQDILEICCGLDAYRDTVVACLLKGSVDATQSMSSGSILCPWSSVKNK